MLAEFNLDRPMRRDMVDRPPHMRGAPKHLSVAELHLARVHLGVETDDYTRVVSGLIVGENPGPNTHWALPLFPWPATSSAGRLLTMAAIPAGRYLGGLYRRNLVDDQAWSKRDARSRARELMTALFDQSRELRVVMLGVKVAKSFEISTDFWIPQKLTSRQTAVVVPHPSGTNRMYNDGVNRRLTGAWLRWAVGDDRP